MSSSRDPLMLYPPLRKRWEWLRDEWAVRYPYFPEPFLTCTYRDPKDQQELYAEGKTLALPGESLHNYLPAFAFDIAFRLESGDVTWDMRYYRLFADMAKALGLEWGGDWTNLVDGPHFQMPMTWQMAKQKKIPGLPTPPKHSTKAWPRPEFDSTPPPAGEEDEPEGDWKLVVIAHTGKQFVLDVPHDHDLVSRYDARRQRYYVVIRKGET